MKDVVMQIMSERSEIILKLDRFPGGNNNLSLPITGDSSSITMHRNILLNRWELTGNYPVFTMVMVIYHYVERI